MTSTPVRPLPSFYYSVTDFLISDIRSLEMVDEAFADRIEWIKKSIRTTAKVRHYSVSILLVS